MKSKAPSVNAKNLTETQFDQNKTVIPEFKEIEFVAEPNKE